MLQEGIVSYSDSDDGEEENNTKESLLGSDKLDVNKSSSEQKQSEREDLGINTKKNMKRQILPLPTSISRLFKVEDDDDHYDECDGIVNHNNSANKHQGRKRTFDHVEGNWATFVFFPPVENNNLSMLHEEVCKILKKGKLPSKLHFIPLKDCHLTISRTVPVRHYWMDTIFTMLKKKFGIKSKFFYSVTGLEVYTNDDVSRTFISLKVETNSFLLDSVAVVDEIFKEFDLPFYYTEPSFHISIAWCLGNHKESLCKVVNGDIIGGLLSKFDGQLRLNLATRVCVKFGHKLQQVDLI